MYATTARRIAPALLVVAALALAGCSSGTQATPVVTAPATSTATPTSTAPAAPVRGPITTPASGSAERAAVLKAASLGLGISGKVTVYQLFVQDGSAVGDLQPATGSRTFFALSGGPGAWDLVWSAPFGSSLAAADALSAVNPDALSGLAAMLDFTKKASKPLTKAAPTLASFEAFALKSAKTFAGATYAGDFTIRGKIAKDSTGAWWGNALAEPTETGLESIGVWARYSNGTWTGEIADFSTEGADAAYFPADVLPKLAL
jgi:hypothetical protein